MISGLLEPAVDRELTGWLFVKGLALVYAVAFASLGVQIDGLVGPDGILPFGRLLHGVYAEQGITALARLPTLFWLDSSGTALRAAAFGGTAVAVLLALGRVRSRPALIVLFVLYLSLVQAGQIFTLFQWDTLLLESGFLAIFLADSPTRLNVLTLEWLLFRLRFESGFFKLASGDPPWRHFTALNYYFETQPLPHIGSWYAQQLPIWLKQTGVGFTFFTELVVPFLIFLPRPFRLFAACVTIFAQLLIIATSNHNFINLLTIVLCLFLLDDRIVALVVPASLQERIRARARARAPGIAGKAVTGAAAALVVALSVSTMLATQMTEPLPRALVALDRIAPAFGIGADYHLFPTMQTERQELRIYGSYDGKTWQAYVFRYKPDALDRAPKFIVPYQPRLDWMMWFVPPQWPDTDFWLDPFLQALRQNRPAVTRLLKSNPFEGKAPPTQLRVLAYRYRFTTPQERGHTGNWWQAEYLGEFPDVPPRRP